MPLEEQLIELPIIGGIAEKDDNRLTMRVERMINCLERKTGAIAKRYGYTAIGRYNLQTNDGTTSTPPTPESLFAHGDELLRIGRGELATHQVLGSSTDWVYRDRVPDAIGTMLPAATTAGAAAGFFADPSVATGTVGADTFAAVAYVVLESAGVRYQLCLDVTNLTTGARIATGRVITMSAAGTIVSPRVAIAGGVITVWCYDSFAGRICGNSFDLATMAALSSGTLVASAAMFDVAGVSSTETLVLYRDGGGLVALSRLDSGFAVKGTATTVAAGTLTCASLKYTADRVWMSWGENDGANFRIRAQTATLTPALQSGVCNVRTFASAAAPLNCGIEQKTSTTAVVAWTFAGDATDYGGTRFAPLTFTGPSTLTAGTVTPIRDTMLLSRPLAVSATRVFALLCTVHGTHGTQVLVDLAEPAAYASVRLVGVIGPRQNANIRTTTTSWLTNNLPRFYGVSDFASAGSSVYLVASTLLSQTAAWSRVQLAEWRFDGAWSRTAAPAGDLLAISGGVVSLYDGSQAFEAGFLSEPDIDRCGASPAYGLTSRAGGGGMTAGAAYGYCYVYAWTDAQGNVHRSAPSKAATLTLGGADNVVDGTVPPLHLTNKYEGTHLNTGPTVAVEIYRTQANGSAYHFLTALLNVVNGAPLAFTDSSADTAIAGRRVLYTTGGVLPSQIPPSASLVTSWRGALVLAGTDDGSMYWSRPVVPGDGPAFNGAFTQAPWEGGPVTALADLMGALVAFKGTGVYRIAGEPPTDLGQSSLTQPELVQGDVGCTGPRAVVQSPDGIEFGSSAGLALLDRSWGITVHGRAVETTFAGATWAGAALVPGQALVRFVSSGHRVAVRDYYHSRLRQNHQWSTDELTSPGTGLLPTAVACAVWRGTFVWIDSTGKLFQETTASSLDVNGSSTTWVVMTFKTASARVPGGLTGRFRCWEAALVGANASPLSVRMRAESDRGTTEGLYTKSQIDAFTVPFALRVRPAVREVSRLAVEYVDEDPVTDRGDGSGATIRSIALRVGIERGTRRLPESHKR
jgi:hypothetical protein